MGDTSRIQGITDGTPVPVDGSGVTQPISVASLPLPTGAATELTLADCKTALQIIDNFISGSRGLVTEDNSASIKTAVEIIDNMISGNRGLVTEDNSASIKTALEIMDDWDSSDSCKVKTINYPATAVTSVSCSSSGNNTVAVTPGTNKHLVVKFLMVSNTGANNRTVYWRDGASGAAKFEGMVAKYGGTIIINLKGMEWALSSNTDLVLNNSAADAAIYASAVTESVDD